MARVDTLLTLEVKVGTVSLETDSFFSCKIPICFNAFFILSNATGLHGKLPNF